MSGRAFIDTNILVYARDACAAEKQARAEALMQELWASRKGVISVQVLNEYFLTVTQKLKPGMSSPDAWSDVVALKAWNPLPMDWPLLERARSLHKEVALSWWDALIVAAAQAADCEILYSEDLATGQTIGGVRIVNPFAQSVSD